MLRWLCVAAGTACMIASYASYVILAWRRQVAPDKAAYLVWAVLLAVATKAGADLSDWWSVAVMAAGAVGVTAVAVCAWTRSGVWIESPLTWTLLALGVAAAGLSVVADRASIVLVLVASLAALSLELRKTWRLPHTEAIGPWIVSVAAQVFAVGAAVGSGWWPAATPLLYASIDSVMCAVIVWSPHRRPPGTADTPAADVASPVS